MVRKGGTASEKQKAALAKGRATMCKNLRKKTAVSVGTQTIKPMSVSAGTQTIKPMSVSVGTQTKSKSKALVRPPPIPPKPVLPPPGPRPPIPPKPVRKSRGRPRKPESEKKPKRQPTGRPRGRPRKVKPVDDDEPDATDFFLREPR